MDYRLLRVGYPQWHGPSLARETRIPPCGQWRLLAQPALIAIFVAGLFAGLRLGRFSQSGNLKEAWRLPTEVICSAAGIAIALIAWSS